MTPTEVGGPDGRGFGYIPNLETGKIETRVFLGRRADPFGGNVLIEGSAEICFPCCEKSEINSFSLLPRWAMLSTLIADQITVLH